jgi:hypothetical protein
MSGGGNGMSGAPVQGEDEDGLASTSSSPAPYLLIFSSAGIGLARSIGGEIQRAEVSGGMGGGRRVDGWESEGEMGAQSKPSLFIQH